MTNERTNDFGQKIGEPLPKWTPRVWPPHTPLKGRFCSIEKLDPERHIDGLFSAFSQAEDDADWTYMFMGPFHSREDFAHYLQDAAKWKDPLHHAILVDGKPVGTAALMRIDPVSGTIEVGHICYSRQLQGTLAGTEAMFLFLSRVFDELGYRRCEWKCDSLNEPSRRAAKRYGFQYEGLFRQAVGDASVQASIEGRYLRAW